LFFYLIPPLLTGFLSVQNQTAQPQISETATVHTESLSTIDSRRQALSRLEKDQERWRQTKRLIELVQTNNEIAALQLKLNDPGPAFDAASAALTLARHSGSKTLLVDTLVLLARVHRFRQDNRTAVRLLDEANQLSRRLKYRQGEAQSLTELGATYYPLSEFPKAQSCTERALQIWRELNDKRGEATGLISLGEIQMRLGKSQEATAALEKAASIWRELGSAADQATALVDLNFLSIRQGEWQRALSLLSQAQDLVIEKEAEPYLAGQIANSFGEVYEVYGKLEIALTYYEEAVRLYRDYAHDPAAAIDVTRQAGRVRARLGDYDQAVQEIQEALKLARHIESPAVVALCHEDLGIVHLENGFYDQAKHDFLTAISGYPQIGSRREWARAQTFLGQTEYSLANVVAAAEAYQKALKVFADNEDYTDEAALCFGLGKLALQQHRLDEAGEYLKRSIALTEQLRENAASKELRSSFLASVHDRYETYVEWLMNRHAVQPDKQFAVEAFEACELGRARSLLDSLQDYQKEMRRVSEPSLLITEASLQKQEQSLIDKRAKLLSQGSSAGARIVVESELREVRARYEALEAQINSSLKYTNLLRPAALSYNEIKEQVTDAETTLLEYSLGDQKSYLWVVTPDGLQTHELASRETIERAVRRLVELLSNRPVNPTQENELRMAIDEVSRLILGPLGNKLNARRLIIVADGILQYVPFQVLSLPPNGNLPLVTQYEIVNAPSASTLAMLQREAVNRATGSKLLAAFGDPVLASNNKANAAAVARGSLNERLAGNLEQQRSKEDRSDYTFSPAKLAPLVFTKIELNELRKLGQEGDSVVYSGFAATRDNLRKLDLSQYRILHFATHGFIDARQPELSGLVLSLVDADGQPVDGFVGLNDIYKLHAPVDLVVLSACRTALGKDVRGEGLISLTRGFMYAGASSVVASLWKVDDEATSELMKRFYTNMLQRDMTPATALRAAQNSIMLEPQWTSPYYWAAFTIQGDYRHVIKSTPSDATALRFRIIVGVALTVLFVGIAEWYRRRRGMRTQ
jgi:CHAT domain-containing protein/tetratricopeptide (TPR) repeat protein